MRRVAKNVLMSYWAERGRVMPWLLGYLAGMAGGCRQQGGDVPLPEGAGATDLLPEEGVQPSGGRGAHAEPTLLPSGVLPVWRGSSGGFGEAQAGRHLLPALWTRVQRGRDGLLLQV